METRNFGPLQPPLSLQPDEKPGGGASFCRHIAFSLSPRHSLQFISSILVQLLRFWVFFFLVSPLLRIFLTTKLAKRFGSLSLFQGRGGKYESFHGIESSLRRLLEKLLNAGANIQSWGVSSPNFFFSRMKISKKFSKRGRQFPDFFFLLFFFLQERFKELKENDLNDLKSLVGFLAGFEFRFNISSLCMHRNTEFFFTSNTALQRWEKSMRTSG